MGDLFNLFLTVFHSSLLNRVVLLIFGICALTGFMIYLYILLVCLIALILLIVRKFPRPRPEPLNATLGEFISFTSEKDSRIFKKGGDTTYLRQFRDWFSYSPDVKTITSPAKLIMTPKRFFGRMTGLEKQKAVERTFNPCVESLLAEEVENEEVFKTPRTHIGSLKFSNSSFLSPEPHNYTLNSSQAGFERIDLTAVEA